MNKLEALAVARRLELLGLEVHSAELAEQAKTVERFAASGNRKMRRAAKRAARRCGR